jgi:hypothetical protein
MVFLKSLGMSLLGIVAIFLWLFVTSSGARFDEVLGFSIILSMLFAPLIFFASVVVFFLLGVMKSHSNDNNHKAD